MNTESKTPEISDDESIMQSTVDMLHNMIMESLLSNPVLGKDKYDRFDRDERKLENDPKVRVIDLDD